MPAASIARAHYATERIDFARQMTFADTADCRVAAHLPERLDILRDQQRSRTTACRRARRLGAGMPAANDDAVELFWISRSHKTPILGAAYPD